MRKAKVFARCVCFRDRARGLCGKILPIANEPPKAKHPHLGAGETRLESEGALVGCNCFTGLALFPQRQTHVVIGLNEPPFEHCASPKAGHGLREAALCHERYAQVHECDGAFRFQSDCLVVVCNGFVEVSRRRACIAQIAERVGEIRAELNRLVQGLHRRFQIAERILGAAENVPDTW